MLQRPPNSLTLASVLPALQALEAFGLCCQWPLSCLLLGNPCNTLAAPAHPCPLQVHSSVLSGLPNLQSLFLDLDGFVGLVLGTDFSWLSVLTHLALGLAISDGVQLDKGSFPAGLKRLSQASYPETFSEADLKLALSGVGESAGAAPRWCRAGRISWERQAV